MRIDEMAATAYEDAEEKGWNDDVRSFGDECALLHSEISEALEAYRDRSYAKWTREDGKPEGVMSELADVAIRLGHLSETLWREEAVTQTLSEAIAEKMAFNRTRPYRHGGKRL